MKRKIFLFIGRSAVGKTSIAKGVCEKLGLRQVKSYTTRPMRTGENEENSDHLFISEFQAISFPPENIAAYTEINGYKYFTTYDVLDNADIYVIDPRGVEALKRNCADRYEFIEIYIRVPFTVAKLRAKNRKDEKGFMIRRDKEDAQFKSYEANHSFHYNILNVGTLEDGVNTACKWIAKELEEMSN